MPSLRVIATLVAPLLGIVLLAALWNAWQAPASGLAAGHQSQTAAAEAPATPAPSISPATPADGDASIAAAALLRRFCDLVDRGRPTRAAELLAGPWVWPYGELRAVSRLRFRSADLRDTALADDLVFITRCRMRLRASPAPHHIARLVFTLGRGGTDGGWLITAVTPRP